MAKLTTSFTPNLYRALVLALLLIGLGVLNASGVGNVASAGTVVLLLVRALMASQLVSAYAQSAAEFVPFVDEIARRLDTYAAGSSPEGSRTLINVESLALDGVSHSYDGEVPVLDHIELEVMGGGSIGLLGASGAGKSTLLSIILGLITPRNGRVLVNGTDIRDFTNASLRSAIAAVPQDPMLINATVAENIAFMRPGILQADVERAALAAGIHDEILGWPDGYETIVGERGARALSGGQRQRVCIARALAGRPSLMILDEPTSALDNAAEEVVNQTLERLSGGCAVIVVSHRPEVLARCDRVLRLDGGRLLPDFCCVSRSTNPSMRSTVWKFSRTMSTGSMSTPTRSSSQATTSMTPSESTRPVNRRSVSLPMCCPGSSEISSFRAGGGRLVGS